MNRDRMIRYAGMLAGGGTIFGLEQGLGTNLYIAIPAGIVAYVVTLVALGFMFGSQTK